MTEPAFERSPSSRIERSAQDEVKAIQTLLSDAYRDTGDGRTLLRELVQNADDAQASRLAFAVVDQGLPTPKNTLLKGPALIVVNDGPFFKRDQRALRQALGDAKAADAEKVGQFGVGLKSVFHVCEAFVYLGAAPDSPALRPGVLNPWAGTGTAEDRDPLHPDWDTVEDSDAQILLRAAQKILGSFEAGLLLWIPLRRPEHLDRGAPEGEPYGLRQHNVAPKEIVAWFEHLDSMALLIAQCGHLRSVEAFRAATIPELINRTTLMSVRRPNFKPCSWVGRYTDDKTPATRTFHGTIRAVGQQVGQQWSVAGVDAVGHERLRETRVAPDWPRDRIFIKDHADLVPRKALAHAAITVLHQPAAATDGVRVRWAVFLPLDNAPAPRSGPLVESQECAASSDQWEIVMHGYFWPSHDRRSIPGVTNDQPDDGEQPDNVKDESRIRARWNRGICDELMLPLLPQALEFAVRDVPHDAARSLLVAVSGTKIMRKHLSKVTKNHMLLPVLTEHGSRWNVFVTGKTRVLAIPSWNDAPSSVRKAFVRQTEEESTGITFIDADAPRIGGKPSAWTATWIGSLLRSVSVDLLRTPRALAWVEKYIGCILKRQSDAGEDDLPTVVADWIAERIGEGALTETTDSPPDTRQELRDTWRRLYDHFPNTWLVHAPVESQRSVAELATAGALGAGLLPVPFGLRETGSARPDPELLDRALVELGRHLASVEGVTRRAYESRLALAETLLAIRDDRHLGNHLAPLPLIRALRLPEDRHDAWTANTLRQRAKDHRVFARRDDPPSSDQGDTQSVVSVLHPEELVGRARRAASKPRQAITELAEAVGESFWLVRGVPLATDVPSVTKDALADAVLHATSIANAPESRIPLLKHLAEGEVNAQAGRAMRVLLTGVTANRLGECDIYHVRSGDTQRKTNGRTLDILLRLRRQPWRAAEPKLVELLPPDLYEKLRMRVVDPGVLQRLTQETLDDSSVDWLGLEHTDVLHLLKHLHGAEDDLKQRWRALPLHLRTTGDRGLIDNQTALAKGCLPRELEDKVTLLNPDPQVEELYLDLPQLDEDGVLRVMLENEPPHRFACQIIDRLRPDGDQIILPRDQRLRAQLTERPWLPAVDSGPGIAPELLLCLPPKLLELVAPLCAALGEHRLSSQVAMDCWSDAKSVVHEILERPGPGKQIERLAEALDTDAVAGVKEGAYLILPHFDDGDDELIKDALKSPPLIESHAGWKILRTAADVVPRTGGNVPRAVSRLARAFCASVSPDGQYSTLTCLAKSRPKKGSPIGRVFRRLVQKYAKDPGFVTQVLPRITLPTQDGAWRPPSEIARSSFGVARRHRVLEEYRSDLRLEDCDAGRSAFGARVLGSGSSSDSVFAPYFKSWENRVKHSAVGALLSLFGNGNDNATLQLSKKWMGATEVAYVRRQLTGDSEDRCSNVSVFVSGSQEEEQVMAVNILGNREMMMADRDNETIFASAPERDRAGFWKVALRHVNPQKHSARALTDMLGKTIELWAVRALDIDRSCVQQWWRRWGAGSQAEVEPVRTLILAALPLTLRQLDVHENSALQEALQSAEREQKRRVQAADGPELQAAADSEKQALDRLASLIEKREHSVFLRDRVRERIKGSGYTVESTLLELVQNADDALAQAREIAGRELAKAARRVEVRVNDEHGTPPTVDLKHFGRPINDTGDAEFAAELDRQWDQDLYFMMLMNLTAKPGESSEPGTAASTTGCFGLGFKSVHLISDAPSVVSRFIAFSITGGLLPKEEQVPDDPDLVPVDGQHVTRVRLPLRSDKGRDDLLDQMFRRFHLTRPLLPAFTRAVREIVVDGGGRYSGVSIFDDEPIVGASGWSVARTPTELPNFGSCLIMRFRPPKDGTAAIVLGIRDGKAEPFPNDLPFLWNITPTNECWGCGYAVNGPFKLDHGRTHVALNHEKTQHVARQLGTSLGKGLIALHKALANNAGPACGLPGKDDVAAFTASLWKVLSSGIDTQDDLRRDFLGYLHGPGRGISEWMGACSVVPSELPAPFREQLPALETNMRIAFAAQDRAPLWRAVAEIKDMARLARGHLVVSHAVAERLCRLLPNGRQPRRLEPTDVFSELAESWDHRITPDRLHALRPLATEDIWKLIGTDDSRHSWSEKLVAQSVAGTLVPLRDLLLPADPNLTDAAYVDQPETDEPKRAAFAPDTNVLDSAYITVPEDAAVFRRLRTRLQIGAATMAAWFADDLANAKRPAAMSYLLHGSLKTEVLEKLIPSETRPLWLIRSDVSRMIDGLGEDWQCHSLLSALFPDLGRIAPETLSATVGDPDTDFAVGSRPPRPSEGFFDRLQDWWDCARNRQNVLDDYEKDAWPEWLRKEDIACSLLRNSDDHWLGLLVLGACQGLGRSQNRQHRVFLESAHREQRWKVFRNPNEPESWMRLLDKWHAAAVDHLGYANWMSLFPTIYLLSRYLNVYRNLLRTADQRPDLDDLTRLLSPRSDSALSGAGSHFDAPPAPLNMGLHWILRELVRLEVLDRAEHLLPYCWVPSEQVFRVLGLSLDGNASNSDKARAVFNFLEPKLRRTPHLHYAFDIPLRYVDANERLSRELGL